MKKLPILFALCVCALDSSAQYWTAAIPHAAVIAGTPSQSGARLRFNLTNGRIYEWNPTSLTWVVLAQGFDIVGTGAAPVYTPAYQQSLFALSTIAGGDSLYYFRAGAWHHLNPGGGGGGGATDLTFSVSASSPITLFSSTGTDVTATAGTGIGLSSTATNATITNTAPDQIVTLLGGGINVVTGTYPNFTVTGTEVDGSVTNEIQQIDTFSLSGNTLLASLSGDGVPAKTVDLSSITPSTETIQDIAGGMVSGNVETLISVTYDDAAGKLDFAVQPNLSNYTNDAGFLTAVAWGSITGTLSNQTDLQSALDGKVDENAAIIGATKTKITYDAKGLVTAGADATTSDIAEGSNLYYTDERVDDRAAALIQNGTGLAWTYVDGAGTLTGNVSLAAFSTSNLSEGSNLYFTDERAQDAVGAMADANTLTYTDLTPLLAVKTQMSITSDASGLKLDGDATTPGNNKVYGTDGSGVKGWQTPAGGGITTLNTLTAATQTFATGTAGTDFAINSATSTHTFDLPTASATNRGALSSADWSAFNAKQAAGNYITALTGDVTATGPGSVAATIANDAVTNAKLANVATATFKGRITAAIGDPEDLTVAQAKTLLDLTGTNSGDQTITLTGDVTGSGTGSFAATIANSAVTLAKMADVATSTVFYRKTAGTGAPEVQTLATLKTDLGLTGTNSGDVTLAGETYLSLAGQVITAAAVNLSGTHATGTLAAARFGALTGDITNTVGTYATTITDNVVTGAKIALASQAAGSTMYYNGTDWIVLGIGTALQQLRVNAGATAPEWATISGGGITDLNGLTATTQTFAVGTAGSDFAISSVTSTHTFNLPTASASNRGALSTADWSTFNAKQPAGVYAVDGGNTLAASLDLGTTDQNTLTFLTNSVTRASVTGGATTGGAWTFTDVTANTNTVENVFALQANSTGTAAASFGSGVLFQGESSTTDNQDMARIFAAWTTATHATRNSRIGFDLVIVGAALATVASFSATSDSRGQLNVGTTTPVILTPAVLTIATGFTVGNSAQSLILGGSSGTISTITTSTSAFGIIFQANENGAASTAGIRFGNTSTNLTQTSGTRDYINIHIPFAPSSGTAVHNQMSFLSILNQTGSATGITRGIFLNQTLTAVADFRAIEIACDEADAKLIYQTGTLGRNNIMAKTRFGSTSAPTAQLNIDQTATATGVLKGIIYTGAVNTNQTLSTEIPAVTITTAGREWATGALTLQREVLITAPTYSFVGTSTITDAATLGIAGAPIKSTNATITNTHAVLIQAGAVSTAANSYGLSVNAQTGATNNYAAQFIGGNVGIGSASPTALLFLGAGTTTVPPQQFAGGGTLISSPLALALEPDVDVLKLTTTTGTIRRTLTACSSGRATAQTVSNASVATYTLGASDATYEVSANVNVTTSNLETFRVDVDYTDETNTARTVTLNFQIAAGTISTVIANANGAVPYTGIPVHIRCKASTTITAKTAGVFTGATYNVESSICQKG